MDEEFKTKFFKLLDKYYTLKHPNELGIEPENKLMALMDSYSREAVEDALEIIAQNEGWEDSRDYYAAKLGLPYKYVDYFHKPLESLGGKPEGKPNE